MGKLDAGNARTPEKLEATHNRGASAFNRSMILLNEIVERLAESEARAIDID